ncbi:hypothetical protein [Ferrimicrobium acidiphilum]|uniref:hypothetical protein n=1 Tax=Ferrimicrobium acidiphilum TaxID=121039 RepID=UPI0023F17825|nr:hypothetical protein [Ferrimicrobium acidiphilum]
MRKQYHFRTAKSGSGFDAFDVDRLIELSYGLPIENVALASITDVDTPYWFYTNPELPTVREVIEHTKLIHEANLTYPILLSIDGEVMDGMHRVAKAILEGSTTIRAIHLPALGEPDYRNCLPGELQY